MKFTCYFCSRNFYQSEFFKKHLRAHLQERPFSCSVCKQKEYHDYQSLKAHYKTNHMEHYKTLVKSQERKKKLKLMLNRCYFCFKSFKQPFELLAHMSSHTLEEAYKCDFFPCKRRYSNGSSKCQHMKHSCPFNKCRRKEERRFSCYFCASKVTTFANLGHHMRSHTNEKPFKCPVCSKAFSAPGKLAYHDKLKHNFNKRLHCNFCGVKQVTRTCLKRHIQSKHTKDNRMAKCYFCFRRLDHVTPKHMALHTKEKHYWCKHCPVEFREATPYYLHSVTQHVGTPEYFKSKSILGKFKNQCYFCDQPSIRYKDLIAHMHKHTREKFFKCRKCGVYNYSFRSRNRCCKTKVISSN